MPGVRDRPVVAAVARRLRRTQVILPRLAGVAALVLITAAASTAVVAATPTSSVAAHEAGGPIGSGAPLPIAPAPEALPPGDVVPPPADFPTVDGVVPPDPTLPADTSVPADYGAGLGDTSTGDLGTSTGDLSGTVPSYGSGGTVTSPGVGGGGVTTPSPGQQLLPPPAPADVCASSLTPQYMDSTFHYVTTPPAKPAVVGTRTTCVVTSGTVPNPATVLTAVVTDQYSDQDRQQALSALPSGQAVPNPVAFVTSDGQRQQQRHWVWFQQKGPQQRRMVELTVPDPAPRLTSAALNDALDRTAKLFTL